MSTRTLFLPVAIVLLQPLTAMAYIGPGAGLSAIGAALALVGAILLGIVGFLWYPIKRLMKRRKAVQGEDGADQAPNKPLNREQPEESGQDQTGGR
jgi:hypothetical protein